MKSRTFHSLKLYPCFFYSNRRNNFQVQQVIAGVSSHINSVIHNIYYSLIIPYASWIELGFIMFISETSY